MFKFPRFYNPFARIRAMEVTLNGMYAGKRKLRARIRDLNASVEAGKAEIIAVSAAADKRVFNVQNNWQDAYLALEEEFAAHEQAIESFMDERETFKDNLALRDAIGMQLVSSLMGAEAIITANDAAVQLATQDQDELATALLVAQENLEQQAAETLEVVGYVKACEAALEAAGIIIAETEEDGPRVLVSTSAIIAGLRAGTTGNIPEPIA